MATVQTAAPTIIPNFINETPVSLLPKNYAEWEVRWGNATQHEPLKTSYVPVPEPASGSANPPEPDYHPVSPDDEEEYEEDTHMDPSQLSLPSVPTTVYGGEDEDEDEHEQEEKKTSAPVPSSNASNDDELRIIEVSKMAVIEREMAAAAAASSDSSQDASVEFDPHSKKNATVKQLREMCKARGLKTTGNRKELEERLAAPIARPELVPTPQVSTFYTPL